MFIDSTTSTETPVTFKFEYNSDENAFGFRNEQNMFVSFNQGSSIDISDTTALASTVLSGYDFYLADGSKTSGTISSKAAQTYTPSTSNQTIAAGQYLSGAQTIQGDANLTAANIKSGVSIFSKTGTYTSDADATAKNIESGKTAYVNGVKITGNANVVHTIMQRTVAMTSRDRYRAGFNDNYVLVAGGCTYTNYNDIVMYDTIDTYNSSLTKSSTTLNSQAADLYSASNNNYTIFNCGIRYYKGYSSSGGYAVIRDFVNKAFAFNTSLTQSNPTPLSTYSYVTMQGTYTCYKTLVICGSIGQYCIFAGGRFTYKNDYGSLSSATPDPVTVECYNSSLSKNACTNLPSNSINNQAMCGNSTRLFMASSTTYTISYNTSLSQSSHTALSNNPDKGTATVNDFALFAGVNNANVSYYNKYGTLSTTTSLSSSRNGMVGVTLPEFALFVGGNDSNGNPLKTVDVYNSSLSRSLGQSAAYNHTNGQSAKVGEYGFAIGGLENNIDVFYST